VMLLLMGMQLIVAGLVGELLIRVYHEAGGAPQFHAEEVRPDSEQNRPPVQTQRVQAAPDFVA